MKRFARNKKINCLTIKMKEMNCRDIEKNVLFYVEHELSAETNELVESHLAECQHCAVLCATIKSELDSVKTFQLPAEDYYFYTRLQQRMENRKQKNPAFTFIPKRVLQPVVVSILIGIGIFTGITIGSRFNATKYSQTVEETRISQLDTYSEDAYIADISDKQLETLYTSNQ